MPAPRLHGLAGALLAACFGALPLELIAQPDFGDNTSTWADDGECDDPRFEGDGAAATLLDEDRGHDAADCRALFEAGRVALRADAANARLHLGRLEKGDERLRSGEFADGYTFSGTAGERAVVDLRSDDFDPYVFVRTPSGEQFDNDDFDGDASHSRLTLDLVDSGEYRVTVTSYDKGETGSYTLTIDIGPSTASDDLLESDGRLEPGDETLPSGELVDRYEFEGSSGQHVSIDLRSPDFDTYLILRDPAGEQTENDDADDGDVGHSSIEADLTQSGTYEVLVTSYESGEQGAYRLTIGTSGSFEQSSPAATDDPTLIAGSRAAGALHAGGLGARAVALQTFRHLHRIAVLMLMAGRNVIAREPTVGDTVPAT